MAPEKALPHSDSFESAEAYVDSLLDFVGNDELLRTLCGGVHILDFFTSTPDLYTRILPDGWADFFQAYEIMDILELFLREDLEQISSSPGCKWRDGPPPPVSLIEYLKKVRRHLLDRHPNSSQCMRNRALKPTQKLARHVSLGMTVKKVHEVGLFSSYVDHLINDISESVDDDGKITHLIDFGSGQGYLGRALASQPYNRNIVAIESKSHNAERARELDAHAKLAEKQKVLRNKKAFRAGLPELPPVKVPSDLPTPPPENATSSEGNSHDESVSSDASTEIAKDGIGTIQHTEHRIEDGDLTQVIERIPSATRKRAMVISLHSCGNLIHHGLRSLILNPSVKAVAMVGCCYNLITERLGPATHKLPELRPTTYRHTRLRTEPESCDPNGFPMSDRLCNYAGKGVRLNITARMMAVQAPKNWGAKDSAGFFGRHFYRALLQRIFLDYGIVNPPSQESVGGCSPSGHSSGGTPIIIGSLRKSCYVNFVAYVRGALEKLYDDPVLGPLLTEKMTCIADDELLDYEMRYQHRHKDLSVTWALMAFSAGVVEAAIVVDRYLWLKEQPEVREAFVEPVFDYQMSPRNLVVVGVKK